MHNKKSSFLAYFMCILNSWVVYQGSILHIGVYLQIGVMSVYHSPVLIRGLIFLQL